MDSPSTSQSPHTAGADDCTQSTSGTLRTKISLRSGGASFVAPFHLMKPELPPQPAIAGSTDLLGHFGLDHVRNKLSSVHLRKELSSFLPNVPGNVDNPMQHNDSSRLKALIDKPPVMGEIHLLTSTQLAGFKLSTVPLPDDYRAFCNSVTGEDDQYSKRPKHKRTLEHDEDRDDAELEKKRKQRKEDDKEKKKKKKKEKKKKRMEESK